MPLHAAEEVIGMVKERTTNQTEFQCELSLTVAMTRLNDLGGVLSAAVAHPGIDVWPFLQACEGYSVGEK